MQRQGKVRAPVVEGAVLDLQQLDVVAERAELSDRVIVPALLEPQAPAGELKERQVSVRAQLVGKPALIDAGLRRIEVALLNRELGPERVAVELRRLVCRQLGESGQVALGRGKVAAAQLRVCAEEGARRGEDVVAARVGGIQHAVVDGEALVGIATHRQRVRRKVERAGSEQVDALWREGAVDEPESALAIPAAARLQVAERRAEQVAAHPTV